MEHDNKKIEKVDVASHAKEKPTNQIAVQHASSGNNEAKATVIQYNLNTTSDHIYSMIMLYMTSLLQQRTHSASSKEFEEKVEKVEKWIEELIDEEKAFRKRVLEELSKQKTD
ncbi:hypothetical protein IMZ08_00345 [Bacillus luteolus]|uniref:Uncharacterized protein n=1 Tax=Litchfieldia luteola TaxID=682179 RepID=A0ABR9QDD0_9BACI|nr:hypothetical protein [Cytobacillus luteolus]MBE4906504.1 hypothetical protein [Cytobacillus luteolus]MBP1941187.1 putative damage-inducible protein DinB [Cytobacillus luteolus]